MDPVEYTRSKLSSVIELVEQLQAGDFPHSHAPDVLQHIHDLLSSRITALNKLHTDSTKKSVINALCKETLAKIFVVFPLLGFLIRSTDVRNSFELHGPFLRLVRRALGDEAKLVISSEWEFSPFTYEMPDDLGLDDVVFIGIPASESANGLAIPLSGHEFGHNIWRRNKYYTRYRDRVSSEIVKYISDEIWDEFGRSFPEVGDRSKINDILGQQYWKMSWLWAMSHCEEVFCDFIGLLIFKEAYLYAFAYLLAPGLPGTRSEHYPNMTNRVRALQKAAEENGIVVPENYIEQFEDSDPPGTEIHQLLLKISDTVLDRLIDQLILDAAEFIGEKQLDRYSSEDTDQLFQNFALGVPATKPSGLSSIVNAAWRFSRAGTPEWKLRYPEVFSDSRRCNLMLSDLVYKSVEVLEIGYRQGDSL